MLVNADVRVCIIDLMAYWTSHYLLRRPITPIRRFSTAM